MSIVLADQAAKIVAAHLPDYESVETVIESALLRSDYQLPDDPEYIEYLRTAISEAEESPNVAWDPEGIKREGRHKLAER